MNHGEIVGPSPDLGALAARINRAHELCLGGVRMAVEGAIDAGKALIDAKAQLDHGRWLGWVEANCPHVGARMAQRYMRIARSNTSPVTHSTITGALEALAAPDVEPEPEEARTLEDIEAGLRASARDILECSRKMLDGPAEFLKEIDTRFPGKKHRILATLAVGRISDITENEVLGAIVQGAIDDDDPVFRDLVGEFWRKTDWERNIPGGIRRPEPEPEPAAGGRVDLESTPAPISPIPRLG